MPSYLVTIRISADLRSVATALAEEIADGHCEAVQVGLVSTRLESVVEGPSDEPPRLPTWKELRDAEAVAAVRALSPAVVEELRQMWRADARDEAKLVVREFVPGTYRTRIP